MKYPEIIYEDNHLLVVNKPAGALVQGDKTGDEPLVELLKKYIKEKYQKPGEVFLGVPHRLDRPVSGILLFARTSKCLARLNEQFQKKEIQKTYWAVTIKQPEKESGVLIHWLTKNEKQNKSYASAIENKTGLKCELHYKLLGKSDKYFLIEVDPKTGRHHQIRVQLATMGCIIKGDLKYGAPRSNPDGSIHLHARKIDFIHPVKKEPITLEAAPPKDAIWDFFMQQNL